MELWFEPCAVLEPKLCLKKKWRAFCLEWMRPADDIDIVVLGVGEFPSRTPKTTRYIDRSVDAVFGVGEFPSRTPKTTNYIDRDVDVILGVGEFPSRTPKTTNYIDRYVDVILGVGEFPSRTPKTTRIDRYWFRCWRVS